MDERTEPRPHTRVHAGMDRLRQYMSMVHESVSKLHSNPLQFSFADRQFTECCFNNEQLATYMSLGILLSSRELK